MQFFNNYVRSNLFRNVYRLSRVVSLSVCQCLPANPTCRRGSRISSLIFRTWWWCVCWFTNLRSRLWVLRLVWCSWLRRGQVLPWYGCKYSWTCIPVWSGVVPTIFLSNLFWFLRGQWVIFLRWGTWGIFYGTRAFLFLRRGLQVYSWVWDSCWVYVVQVDLVLFLRRNLGSSSWWPFLVGRGCSFICFWFVMNFYRPGVSRAWWVRTCWWSRWRRSFILIWISRVWSSCRLFAFLAWGRSTRRSKNELLKRVISSRRCRGGWVGSGSKRFQLFRIIRKSRCRSLLVELRGLACSSSATGSTWICGRILWRRFYRWWLRCWRRRVLLRRVWVRRSTVRSWRRVWLFLFYCLGCRWVLVLVSTLWVRFWIFFIWSDYCLELWLVLGCRYWIWIWLVLWCFLVWWWRWLFLRACWFYERFWMVLRRLFGLERSIMFSRQGRPICFGRPLRGGRNVVRHRSYRCPMRGR